MNTPPRGGILAVSPTTGFELNGTFALRASYWVDDADDLPLKYSFGYDGNGSEDGGASAVPVSHRSVWVAVWAGVGVGAGG